MKVKVDKEEYERLLKRVEELEDYRETGHERFMWLVNNMERQMEDFFNHKCSVVMVKRDKNMIAAEVRKNIMDNLFKEK